MQHYSGKKQKHTVRRILLSLLLLCVLIGGTLEGVVLAGAHTEISGTPAVMVILGTQVKADGPCRLLRDRLDTAAAYLQNSPDLPVVVSGGQGSDEHISEAEAMKDYLVSAGIDEGRITMEDQSHNTGENLQYTKRLLEEQGYDLDRDNVLVVSNAFHLSRVRMLCARYGIHDSTLAAPSNHWFYRLKSYVREAPALAKSFFFD